MEDSERMEETLDRGEEKTFTQEEVEEIVKRRLARERRKAARGTEGEEDPLTGRESSLAERELRLTARERLQEEGLPMSLADVLRYADDETLDTAIEAVKSLKAGTEPPRAWGQRQSGAGRNPVENQIRKAMGLNQK